MNLTWEALSRPLIIGQAPARGNDGKLPFAGRSGARLAELAGVGHSGDDLPKVFDLVNLLPAYPGRKETKGDNFDRLAARDSAHSLRMKLMARPSCYVLLMGRGVQRAFRLGECRYLQIFDPGWQARDGRHNVVVFPHPSGISHWWNDSTNRAQAKAMMRWILDESPV